MSTGTAHVPGAAHPEDRHPDGRPPAVTHVDDADRATTRLLVVTIVATLAVAWTLVLVYAYVAQEGITVTTGPRVLLGLGVALVPALLAAWAVRLVSATSERGTPTPYVIVAAICVALMMCGVALMAEFGERAHDAPPAGTQATVVAQVVDQE